MRCYALVAFGEPLKEMQRPDPTPKGTEVLLRMRRAGVCHSDLHIAEGFYDYGDGDKLEMADRGVPLPLTMGHEIVGEVVAAGPDAEGAPIGKTVLVHPWIGCGECRACREERENDCRQVRAIGIFRDGGYATHVIAPHPRFLVDIDGLDLSTAVSYACAGVTVYSALKKALPIEADEWLAIMGAGGLGLTAVSVAKALGAPKVAVVDLDADKLAAAREMGADATLNIQETSHPEEDLIQLCDGRLAAVLDAVGAPNTAALGVAALQKTGRYVIVGLIGGKMKLALPMLPQKALTMRGSYVGSVKELRELVALAKQGALKPIPVSERPLAAASETLDDLAAGRIVGRVVLTNDA